MEILCNNYFLFFIVLLVSILSHHVNCYSYKHEYSSRARLEPEPIQKLILTPAIKSGDIYYARESARVKSEPFADTISYSGYITVNETTNSNLFFWFFPAKHDARNAPLMIWLQGGPGFSVMFGLFVEHGPFYINSNGSLKHRQLSWTNSHSMIYVDSPVGTGFSFTSSSSGYATKQEDVARDLYEFMEQFSIMFPEYSRNPLYIGGESYAGKFIPSLALKIHYENQLRQGNWKFNLKGISLGAPFTDLESVLEGITKYYYFMGLFDENEKNDVDEKIANLKLLIEKKDFSQAFLLLDAIFEGNLSPYPSLFKNYTGYDSFNSVLYPLIPPEYYSYVNFLNQEKIQEALHAGVTKFENTSTIVQKNLVQDLFTSVKPQIEKILDLKYKVLISVGQFDMYIPHTTLYNQIRSMNWKGKDAFADKTNKKRIWKVDEELAGYIRRYDNLVYVLIRNAGHDAPLYQPKWCLAMIQQFTHGFQF